MAEPDAPPPSFGAVARSGILPEGRQAESEYQEAPKRPAERVGTRIAEEKQAITAVPHEAPPAEPTLPKPPSVGLTPFLAPVEGERPENTIAKLIQGVGLLATGAAGRKDARASLAPLPGALKGAPPGRSVTTRESRRSGSRRRRRSSTRRRTGASTMSRRGPSARSRNASSRRTCRAWPRTSRRFTQT